MWVSQVNMENYEKYCYVNLIIIGGYLSMNLQQES